MAQARDLSSMHAPMFGLRACLNFFGQGSRICIFPSEMELSSHFSLEIQVEKEIVREVVRARGINTTWENLHITKHKSVRWAEHKRLTDLCFVIRRFSQVVLIP